MKIERLIAIIMLLLQRELIPASELATLFEVSKRTIYRDIDTLALANIPVYTMPGQFGGIGIMPTYKVDKKLLTVDDLATIVTSLDGFEQLLTSVEIKKTLLKMKTMLGTQDKVNSNFVSLDFSYATTNADMNKKVEQLHLAIKKHSLVALSYIDRSGNQTTRKLEPYHLQFRNRSWYIQGYSPDRDDFRTFKLSRIVALDALEESFTPRQFTVKQFDLANQIPPFEMHTVHLHIDRVAREQLIERLDFIELERLDTNYFEVTITLPNHEAGYRYLLQLGTHARLQKRDEFYDGFTTYLHKIQSQYTN